MCPPADSWRCDDVQEVLEAYLDRDLGPAEERAVAVHLRDCAECARELSVAEAVRSELRALPELDSPSRVLWRVRTATSRQTAGDGGRSALRSLAARPVFAAAASVALVVVAAVLWWQKPDPRPSFDDPQVARAARETRYAFALVGALGRRAALDELLGGDVLSPTVRSLSRSLRNSLESTLEDRQDAVSEENEREGSQG
jgi:anti-sigma factor RsiW